MERRGLGQEAEQAAVEHLERQGYRICARNFLARGGELDIVAEKDETVCFVEVRMRSSAAWGDPSQTVTRAKQQKVVRAAMQFLQRAGGEPRMVRFDVVSVVGRGSSARVEHLPNAFDAGM
jgi:putative endonuclease